MAPRVKKLRLTAVSLLAMTVALLHYATLSPSNALLNTDNKYSSKREDSALSALSSKETNGTIPDLVLKRWALNDGTPTIPFAPLWQDACLIIASMFASASDASNMLHRDSQSRVGQVEFKDDGWESHPANDAIDLTKLRSAFMASKQMTPDGASLTWTMDPHGPNEYIRHVQANSWLAHPHYTPMNWRYSNVYNEREGVIVVWDAWGPTYVCGDGEEPTNTNHGQVPLENLPVVNRWSDVTWLQWSKLHRQPDGKTVAPMSKARYGRDRLYYIFMYKIMRPDLVQQVIAACLKERGHLYNIPTWPGEEFELGHWCFNTLIATNNCAGVAGFLISHKTGIGKQVLTSVTIFKADENLDNSEYDYPSLRWTLKPFEPAMEGEMLRAQDAHPLPYP